MTRRRTRLALRAKRDEARSLPPTSTLPSSTLQSHSLPARCCLAPWSDRSCSCSQACCRQPRPQRPTRRRSSSRTPRRSVPLPRLPSGPALALAGRGLQDDQRADTPVLSLRSYRLCRFGHTRSMPVSRSRQVARSVERPGACKRPQAHLPPSLLCAAYVDSDLQSTSPSNLGSQSQTGLDVVPARLYRPVVGLWGRHNHQHKQGRSADAGSAERDGLALVALAAYEHELPGRV